MISGGTAIWSKQQQQQEEEGEIQITIKSGFTAENTKQVQGLEVKLLPRSS